jgi:predicted nucleic acid-binding protein
VICLDASVVAKLFLQEERSELADALYDALLAAGNPIIAPPLLLIELTNITRKQMRGATGISLTEATAILENLIALPIEIRNPDGLHVLALAIADEFGLPATYDAHYIALAALSSCDFWTDDQRLVHRVGQALPFVRWLGVFVPNAAK